MATTDAPPAFAPSIAHRRLADATAPQLVYTGGDVSEWREKLRPRLRELIGYDLLPEAENRPPLNMRSLWRRDHAPGTIEKLIFTAEPEADVPAYLCLPHDAQPPYPVFICLQGHTSGMHNSIGVAKDDETRPINVPGDRDFALSAMKRGLAALCIEQRAFGERAETEAAAGKKGPCHEAVMHALMLGRTLAAERLYDVDRAIDLLSRRDDMDLARLGVMGNSGGGSISILAGALLPRIQAIMPSCAFCTYHDSIMAIHHCADNYIPRILRYAEMADVLGLAAPKPLVVVAGQSDQIFPLHGVQEAFAHLQTIYRAAHAEDRCELVVGPGGHRFYADLAWPRMLALLEGSNAN